MVKFNLSYRGQVIILNGIGLNGQLDLMRSLGCFFFFLQQALYAVDMLGIGLEQQWTLMS